MAQVYSLILVLFFITTLQPNNKNNASYNSKVKFRQGKQINFPDFTIEYTGKRSIPGPGNAKWSMTVFNFTLLKGDQPKQISWSSGTGVVAPLLVEFNQEKFIIELGYSPTIKKWLKKNEFVIRKDSI